VTTIRFMNDLKQRLLFDIRQYVFRSTLFSGDLIQLFAGSGLKGIIEKPLPGTQSNP
jgi:hypothetical protein